MSWMDTWSRQAKHAAVPPPFYLTVGNEDVRYCQTCGRVISDRKTNSAKATNAPVKYCTERCRRHKPRHTASSLDCRIEEAFVTLLNGEAFPRHSLDGDQEPEAERVVDLKEKGKMKRALVKGDPRVIVMCDTIDAIIFQPQHDERKVFGRKKNRASRVLEASDDQDNQDSADPVVLMTTGTRIRKAQTASLVNGSIGGEKGRAERIDETPEMLEKRLQGQRRVEELELVRNAARRGCAFGFLIHDKGDEGEEGKVHRKCEAVMKGTAVEASYAKGEWGIRWRQ